MSTLFQPAMETRQLSALDTLRQLTLRLQ